MEHVPPPTPDPSEDLQHKDQDELSVQSCSSSPGSAMLIRTDLGQLERQVNELITKLSRIEKQMELVVRILNPQLHTVRQYKPVLREMQLGRR